MRIILPTFGYLLCAVAGCFLTLLSSNYIVGSSFGRYGPAKVFTAVADYAGLNADHSSLRNAAQFEPVVRSVLSSDVLLYGSSKGLFGLRAQILNDYFGGEAKFYNISQGYGEGLPFLAQIIAENGIHDRIVVADLTDVASQFDMSPAAIDALDMGVMESLTRAILVNSRYQVDLVLSAAIPAISVDRNGFSIGDRLRPYEVRDPGTGDDDGSEPGDENYPIVLGHLSGNFGAYGGLLDRLVPFLRCRNISVIAIAIPFSAAPGDWNQFDPEFTRKSAERAGFRFLPIPYEGLYTRDWIHLTYESSFELSRRLADTLSALGSDLKDTVDRNRMKQSNSAAKCDTPGITTPVKLIKTEPHTYTVSFHDHRFVIPNGAEIDWRRPVFSRIKGVTEAR